MSGLAAGSELCEGLFNREPCSFVFSEGGAGFSGGGAVFSRSMFVGSTVFMLVFGGSAALTLSVLRGGLLSKVLSIVMEGVSPFSGVGMVVVAVEIPKTGSIVCGVGVIIFGLGGVGSSCKSMVEGLGAVNSSRKSTVEELRAVVLE